MHRTRPHLTLAAAPALLTAALAGGGAALVLAPTAHSASQIEGVPVTGDRLGGFVIPVEPGERPARFNATRANLWKVDSTQRLYLQGQVNVQLGAYDFYAESAVVWIERIPSAKGVITQFAVWFPQTSEPTKAAGLGAGGTNLLITGSTLGETTLSAVITTPEAPRNNQTVRRAEERLRDYLLGLESTPQVVRTLPDVRRQPPPPPPPPLEVGGQAAAQVQEAPTSRKPAPSPEGERRPAIIAPQSMVAFVAEKVEIDTKKDVVTLTSGVTLDVLPRSPGQDARMMQMRAERAVIFLKPGTTEGLRGVGDQVPADAVLGVYLEGDVSATDFDYTVRAKRAYYDFASNKATLVEGVLRTKDRKGLALVARAQELRQYSQDQWQGDKVVVSTSEFFVPHLSVGVERATITRTLDDQGDGSTLVQGQDVTARAGGTPFFWWPNFEGTGEDIPFRGLGVNYQGNSGARITTKWDLLGLMGIKPPPADDLTLYTDAWTNWAAGMGVRGTLSDVRMDLFGLYDFGNVEQTSAGRNVTATQSFRGIATGDTTIAFTDDTKLQLQGSYVSDESFMQVFRQREFANQFQKETSAYLVSAGEHSELSLLLNVPTNAVITSSQQLAARPYQVEKYPEAAYKRWGDSLFNDNVTWTQEYSANLMAIRIGRGTTGSTGVRKNTFNLANSVMPDGNLFTQQTGLEQLYESSGYEEDTWSRLYTRQELALPLKDGGVRFTPFASLAVSGYVVGNPGDYTRAADRLHALAAGGARFSADIIANYDQAEIAFLDLHRLRHVVTPYANAWYGWDNTTEGAYPIYDQDIEGATGGAVVQAGIRQRFQTMRGGPGNWQSVDWLVVDGGVTWNDDSDTFARTYTDGAKYKQSPFPQYFAWRPELSQWGRSLYGSFKWAASSTLTFSGNLTYLLDSSLPNLGTGPFGLANAARGSIGASMQHTPEMRTFIEYRAINNNSPESIYLSDQLLAAGVVYQVSKTYELGFTPTYDLQEGDFRAFSLNIARQMPDFTLLGTFGYDAVMGQYYGGLAIRIGGEGGGVNFSGFPGSQ